MKPFIYTTTINFRDTDAAGVVYFANGLALCHAAYEASLTASAIDLQSFFRGKAIAVPITHASIDFFQPMFCGDRLAIELIASSLSENSFQIEYQIYASETESLSKKAIARALTKHTCIDSHSRKRSPLSAELLNWLAQFDNV